ncbi:hypothetical protein vseg_010039 [Gypsophila vaccaria]
MNASKFMDKQIMDLSRSSLSDDIDNNNNNNNKSHDFIDLMNPQSDEVEINHKPKHDILPNYDFHPISRPTLNHSNLPNFTSPPSYGSLDHAEPDKIVVEKAQKANDTAILSEIDRTMTKHTDALMHAIGSLSARLSQIETRTRQLEHSVDDLKASVCNNHGTADGKLRQLENILLEVQSGVQDLKDKQDVMEGHMKLAKLQISKSELPNTAHQDHAPQATAASAPPQQSGYQQFANSVPQQLASMAPPSGSPLSQQNIHPPHPMTSQFSPAATPPGPHQDAYLPPPTHIPEGSSQQYQPPPPIQNQQPAPPAQQPQQYQPAPTPPYPQPPQPLQQQHPSIVGGNAPPQFQSLGPSSHRPDESPYVPPTQTYPPNHYQPASQSSSGPLPTQSYYGSPSPMYEPPPAARSNFSSSYAPQSGPSELYPYGGPTSHYGGGPSVKPQPHSPRGGQGNYPQLPTARVLPPAIPTASAVGGGSSTGGGGNKVPIDDVVDKVTNMGFSRDQVRATVRRLTENGQSVDLNVVLDKLMNDADVQPPKGWFGR